MSDIIYKLRFVRDQGTKVILDQADVIHLLAIIEEKQTLPERVGSFIRVHPHAPFSKEPLR